MKKLITEFDVLKLIRLGATEIEIDENVIITPLAYDRIRHSNLKIIKRSSEEILKNSQASILPKKCVIGSDHTGVKLKAVLVDELKRKSFNVIDIGTFSEESVDYPDYAFAVAKKVLLNEVDFGILIDATGIPSAIAANKLPGIRAATCYNDFSAKSSREHNNANILVLGAKTLSNDEAKSILNIWLTTDFLGERHQRRLDKISAVEQKLLKKF
ncbi:ribose 5-phosphate isomerase B [Melioribacteraceae bacterium 4301-Me]|uniref:ribose 5-phosphate isomerase B n=1 Tax=Pyranulibacter aquaticus TaxID=3163344 RepID=UPI0035973A75